VARVALARRDLLLRVHRHRLRIEDLEDCYSQATLELLSRARSGARFENATHISNALEQKLVSRINDRRRAVSGRSPIETALGQAASLDDPDSGTPDVADRTAAVHDRVVRRMDLGRVREVAEELTPDHASWYVSEVLAWAARYRSAAASAGAGAGSEQVVPGARATLSPANGHVALVPLGAPPAVQAMIAAGNRLQDLPYGPAGHPDPRGAVSEDCSSTVSYVLMAAGARTPADVVSSNPLARDYVRWGLPGPGRWVTIYATTVPTEHVFVVIAGLRLDTSHRGTDVGPNRDQDGPRWRIYDQIPGWASWAVRHPPGL
jgi:hypothetical protein